ncbi:predicted protein [Uncinocarpus reesii 1704]|uniref:Uncharacterized protein n=1 Tax=Uncinocarpus reesii (strain UAMH 1704) TaxID=336963 RepID=C4JKW7_UNCRE|nr:uncharacterized protein UREG_00200 [Uncinocarpus reesii 1704]EEP75354.1 predicted protein [Uncinocarpus reesii 1704]
MIKSIHKEQAHVNQHIEKLMHAVEYLVIEKEILKHENNALIESLGIEKRQHQHDKIMDLFDSEKSESAQFFSSTKVAQIRERNEELEK